MSCRIVGAHKHQRRKREKARRRAGAKPVAAPLSGPTSPVGEPVLGDLTVVRNADVDAAIDKVMRRKR